MNSDQFGPQSGEPTLSQEDRRFLAGMLRKLARDDPQRCAEILEAHPDWAVEAAASPELLKRIRAALTGSGVDQPGDVQATGRERLPGVPGRKPARSGIDVEGVFTSVARHLSPERAVDLFRKIVPVFAYQILTQLNESASVGVVNMLVDHLCSEEVQRDLRNCDHVRSRILEEVCAVLGRAELSAGLTLDDLQGMLEESGAVHDLLAMENCIKLAKSRAG